MSIFRIHRTLINSPSDRMNLLFTANACDGVGNVFLNCNIYPSHNQAIALWTRFMMARKITVGQRIWDIEYGSFVRDAYLKSKSIFFFLTCICILLSQCRTVQVWLIFGRLVVVYWDCTFSESLGFFPPPRAAATGNLSQQFFFIFLPRKRYIMVLSKTLACHAD